MGRTACFKSGTAFAIIRFQGGSHVVSMEKAHECLEKIGGVHQVKVDAARNTIHLLYNGDAHTLHRFCAGVCETGMDVIALRAASPLPGVGMPMRGKPGRPI